MYLIVFIFLIHCAHSYAQNNQADSLKALLNSATADTMRMNALIALSKYYSRISPDESIRFGQEAMEIAQRLGLKKDVASA